MSCGRCKERANQFKVRWWEHGNWVGPDAWSRYTFSAEKYACDWVIGPPELEPKKSPWAAFQSTLQGILGRTDIVLELPLATWQQ